jgi:hypothetical protein|tara:strand:+ start:53 stop:739 length:687 start_codon:yes stop_codon:yes gene_type:complete
MFKCGILEERTKRQLDNDKMVEKLLRANLPVQHLKKEKCVNDKAVDRYLEDGISLTNLDENTIRGFAKYLSVSATRQGSTDELSIVNGINDALVGMSLEKPEKVIIIDGIDKSIDAVLKNHNGAIIGHVFCKVVDGGGGHQDNVKGESLRFLDHASKQNDGLLRVCIVDGNYNWRKKAEQYLSEDVWLCDHQQFQLKLQERYGVELKEIDETNHVKNPLEKLIDANAT